MMIYKYYLLGVFCLIIILNCEAQNNESINVMTFNIRIDNPKDGKQNWQYRKNNVLRMINFYDLDIIGMQEVFIQPLNFLKGNLKQYNVIGVGKDDGKEKGSFNPIFYKKDKFEELRSGTFWLSETPNKISKGWDAGLNRIATWAIFKDKASGKEFFFMNTHFDHRGKLARLESARLLKKKAIELGGDLQAILTGDFNLIPESEGIKTLAQENGNHTIVNSSTIAKHRYGPNWTGYGFQNRPFENRKVIDYIFVNKISKVHRYAVLSEKLNDLQLSDHCPVFVQIELTK